ncbi:hypothetical protein [Rodentibacter caecimuris]|nr:hypothetical protein [Rodentibacter heylii]
MHYISQLNAVSFFIYRTELPQRSIRSFGYSQNSTSGFVLQL